jgi:hypothetical protein
MAYYSKEKAKFGGITGSILPFTIQLPSSNNPADGDWKRYVPAGFLRCNGQILKAERYPALAAVIGIGSECRFAKDPDTIGDDEIQLPDLGSKYIRASNSSGQYLNTTLQQDSSIFKVGTETEVLSLIGSQATISYSGNFEVIGGGEFEFGGYPTLESSTGYTITDNLSEDNFQGHGHSANVGVFTYLAKWTDSIFYSGASNGGNNGQTEGSNNGVQLEFPEESPGSVPHNHRITLPGTNELKDKNEFRYTFQNQTIPATGLTSTITVTTENVKKLDDAVSPYILVEYLIKI